MRKLTFIKLALLTVCVAVCQAQQPLLVSGGAIAGMLRGDDGSILAGGNLTLTRTGPPLPRVRSNSWRTASGAAGEFRFEGLPDGQFSLCAQVPSGVWLNPCEWGPRPPVVSISRGQRPADIVMELKRGVFVPIRIDDPSGTLLRNEGKTAAAHLLLGLNRENFVFYPAFLVSQDSTGKNYGIHVPFGARLNLVVSSSFFQLSDSVGIPLSKSGSTSIPLIVPTGQTPNAIKLIVTGGG